MRISDCSSDVCSSDLSNHFATDYPHLYWMAGGAWVLRMAWDQFAATGDLGTLREYAWPLAQNVMAFAVAVAQPGLDRTSVVQGQSVSVGVDLGGRRIIHKNINMYKETNRR